jgi:hypothetical protein
MSYRNLHEKEGLFKHLEEELKEDIEKGEKYIEEAEETTEPFTHVYLEEVFIEYEGIISTLLEEIL